MMGSNHSHREAKVKKKFYLLVSYALAAQTRAIFSLQQYYSSSSIIHNMALISNNYTSNEYILTYSNQSKKIRNLYDTLVVPVLMKLWEDNVSPAPVLGPRIHLERENF